MPGRAICFFKSCQVVLFRKLLILVHPPLSRLDLGQDGQHLLQTTEFLPAKDDPFELLEPSPISPSPCLVSSPRASRRNFQMWRPPGLGGTVGARGAPKVATGRIPPTRPTATWMRSLPQRFHGQQAGGKDRELILNVFFNSLYLVPVIIVVLCFLLCCI